MILGCDIGNSNIRAGLFREEEEIPQKVITLSNPRIMSNYKLLEMMQQEIRHYLDTLEGSETISGIIYSSVVPERKTLLENMGRLLGGEKPIRVHAGSKLNIVLHYDPPSALGSDRIVNAVAVAHEYQGENAIIIDIGTAITFCVLVGGKHFEGGLIVPGLEAGATALYTATSQLERVTFRKPNTLVARTTLDGIQSGIYYGWISLIEGIVHRIKHEHKGTFRIILTGGAASLLASEISFDVVFDPLLTMRGLKYLYDLNKKE